jgi:hypothetical protein
LTEEGKLRGFESGALMKIFVPKRDEVTGEWKRLHNEELYGLYSSPNIIWVLKDIEGEACGMYWGEESCLLDFGGEI